MEPEGIRGLIRQKLQAGRLPLNSTPRFWSGPADGEVCDACDKPIFGSVHAPDGREHPSRAGSPSASCWKTAALATPTGRLLDWRLANEITGSRCNPR
jgi:hypothetical protein